MSSEWASFPEVDPGASGLHAAWYEANARARHLTAQHCACGVWRHPARYRCAVCRSDVWSFAPIDGVGEVVSATMTRRAFHGAFAAAVPYPIAVVDCGPGLRFFVQLRGMDDGPVAIGSQVELRVDGFGVPFGIPARDTTRDTAGDA